MNINTINYFSEREIAKFRLHDVQTWKKKGGITEHLNEPPTTFSIRKTTCPVGQVDFMLVVSEVVSQRCFCKKVS